MKIMFIHKNYPAQFGQLAIWLAQHGWDVTFATARGNIRSSQLRIVSFQTHRDVSAATHPYLTGTESAVLSGQGMARTALSLAQQGYQPDVVVAHSGWGVGLFIKDVWPDAKYVQYAEWYYTTPYADQTPHSPVQDGIEDRAKARIRNAPFWLDFSAADATICPTRYQASRFPDKLRDQITVLSDGFDTVRHAPAPRDVAFLRAEGIPPDAKLVTYIARGMEPARGFPEVMKAIERLQMKRPDVHAVIIADDRIVYGAKADGRSWKEEMLETLVLDRKRIHFKGLVSRPKMIKFLQASNAHLYLSAPFVLSWSFVEAMSCAAPIVAARSAPVEEFMAHKESGLLVDPYDIDAVANAVEALFDDDDLAMSIGRAARSEIVSKYDSETNIFPRYAKFLSSLSNCDGFGNEADSHPSSLSLPHAFGSSA